MVILRLKLLNVTLDMKHVLFFTDTSSEFDMQAVKKNVRRTMGNSPLSSSYKSFFLFVYIIICNLGAKVLHLFHIIAISTCQMWLELSKISNLLPSASYSSDSFALGSVGAFTFSS